ncbi:MOSC domain-containing protein [Desertibacillus haloalkaliphilus]|uniref:MOSC domain-containing protein n=1 Tax=Desertibacillus haloalkaliphilus TaxID=1328930 RepID=UPI001C27B2AC|nr:MOSC domain-containing protein [Desertibacillus haloalkaliphilus]MBU8905029.1 MOSC domain-containing protein [Desertibacillus haloalkaliphilus]
MIEIVSVNVGQPQWLRSERGDVETGFIKTPVDGPVYLSKENLAGDRQADMKNHGGIDKAVCVYSYDHYHYWERELGIQLEASAFGENLTVRGLTEADVCIGDVFQLGGAVVQVSQPRQPCYKIARVHKLENLPQRVQQTGYSGFYFRVLEEGHVSKHSRLVVKERHKSGVSIAFANQTMYHDKENQQALKKLVNVEELAASWKKPLLQRLEKLEANETQS